MIKLNSIIASSALLVCAGLANAQSTPSDSTTTLPAQNSTMPATDSNVNMNSTGTSESSSGVSATGSSDSSVTTDNSRMGLETDPYIKRRMANKSARSEYKADKRSARQEYKEEKRAAKEEFKDANRGDVSTPSMQQPRGTYSTGQ